MAKKKEAQQPQTETVKDNSGPLIHLDSDKLRFMPVDRKDVIDALASDYEDSAKERLAASDAKIDELMAKYTATRVRIEQKLNKVFELNPIEQSIVASVLPEIKKEVKLDFDEISISIYDASGRRFQRSGISKGELKSNTSTICSDDFLTSNLGKCYCSDEIRDMYQSCNKTMGKLIVQIQLSSSKYSGSDITNVLKDIGSNKLCLGSRTVTIYVKPTKEILQAIKDRQTYALELRSTLSEYRAIEREIKELPEVIRRMKARLTKKVMGESTTGRKILDYFAEELTASKEVQASLPAPVSKKKK